MDSDPFSNPARDAFPKWDGVFDASDQDNVAGVLAFRGCTR